MAPKPGRAPKEPSSSSSVLDTDETQAVDDQIMETIAEKFVALNGQVDLDGLDELEKNPPPLVHCPGEYDKFFPCNSYNS